MAATPSETNTMFQDEGPNFRTGESPKLTVNTATMRAVLTQRILVIMSCISIINRHKKKKIIGMTTRIATNGAGPGMMNCPDEGTT